LECKSKAACPAGVYPISAVPVVNGSIVVASGNCSAGYAAPLCGSCQDTHSLKQATTCEPCAGTTGQAAQILLGIVGVIVIVFAVKTIKQWYSQSQVIMELVDVLSQMKLKTVSKQILANLQIVTNLSVVLSVQFPDLFGKLIETIASWVRFDIIEMFALGCLSGGSFSESLYMNIGLVAAVSAAVGLVYMYSVMTSDHEDLGGDSEEAQQHLKELFDDFDADGDGVEVEEVTKILQKIDPTATLEQAQEIFDVADSDGSGVIDFMEFQAAVSGAKEGSPKDGTSQLDLKVLVKRKAQANIRDSATGRLFLLVFILYPGLTNMIFAGFSCREIGPGQRVLMVDYSIDCDSDDYQWLLLSCAALVVIWPLGLPATLFYSMWRERTLIQEEDRDTLQKFDFALGDYKLSHWYWEVVELARKLALSGLIGLFQRGSVLQTVCATVISFFFFAMAFRERPFEEDRLNAVKIYSEFQIFGILLICIVIQTRSVDFSAEMAGLNEYGKAQVALTMSILPLTIYVVAKGIKEVVEEVVESDDEDEDGDKKQEDGSLDNPLHEDVDSEENPAAV